jgi:hypothetical protein
MNARRILPIATALIPGGVRLGASGSHSSVDGEPRNRAGDYYCRFHPNMKAILVVTP